MTKIQYKMEDQVNSNRLELLQLLGQDFNYHFIRPSVFPEI